MLTTALPDLAAWTAYFRDAQIPVLDSTAAEISELHEAETAGGQVDARMLGEAITGDPLMTIKVLADSARRRSPGQVTDAESVTAAVMLMGMGRFFSNYARLPTIEYLLHPVPGALDGLMRVFKRSQRASRFALAFAVHRMEADVAEVREAALLHDFAELLLWCHAPTLALEINTLLQSDAKLRSAAVQKVVLNVRLDALQQALMRAWQLPELLTELTDEGREHPLWAPQRRMVQLAVRLARHSTDGWTNAALPDDIHDISQMLGLSHGATQRLVRNIDM
jgi:HD-like signal output (HDOD) protein